MEKKRKIKKYSNRKMYDTDQKQYITLDQLSDLIKAGEEVIIEDNDTGEDITSSVLSQILSREKPKGENGVHVGILTQLLRKGGDTISGYAKKYTTLWQSVYTMAEDEIDKIVNKLVKEKELSETEGRNLKKELVGYADNIKKWLGERIDKRINEVLNMMNLATKEQVQELQAKIEELGRTVERLEKLYEKNEDQMRSDS